MSLVMRRLGAGWCAANRGAIACVRSLRFSPAVASGDGSGGRNRLL